MAHFKTLIFACTLFSVNSFAEDLPRVYRCYDSLAQEGLMPSAYFDGIRTQNYNRDPYYISQSSVTDKGFLVFKGRDIYRCDFPKENAVVAMFSTCRKAESNGVSYRLDLKIGLAKHALTVDVPKDSPKKIHISSEIRYRSQMGNETYCEVQCKEELGDANVKAIEAELTEPVTKGYKAWTDYSEKQKQVDVDHCRSAFTSAVRGLQNWMSNTTTTESDCLKRAGEKTAKLIESRRKEVISALKSCSGAVYDSASLEIAKLEGKAPPTATTAKLEADSAGDKLDADSIGKK